jgi:excisionase family DNA binding protein
MRCYPLGEISRLGGEHAGRYRVSMTKRVWRRFDTNRANDRLVTPVGSAEAAPFFDKQPTEPQSHIELLSVPGAAAFLTISVSSMRRLQEGRHIPFFKVGGSIRFAKVDLVSYLARQRIGPVGE